MGPWKGPELGQFEYSFGGDAIWVTNLFGGDAVLETSSTRKPNSEANLKG